MIHFLFFILNPVVFFTIGGVWLLCVGWAAWSKRVHTLVYLTLALGLLFFMRLPVILYNAELNPDESQIIAGAISLLHDPVYWRSTDEATSGPLNTYALVWPGWFGLPIDYLTAHLTGVLLAGGAWLMVFLAVRNVYDNRTARFALLPALALLASTQHFDFIHYSSEHLSLGLLAAAWLLLTRFYRQPSARLLAGVGLLTGMVPFAKLQAVPVALLTAAVGFLFALFQPRRGRHVSALVAGGLAFPALAFGLLIGTGLLKEMLFFYLIANSQYAAHTTFLQSLARFPAFLLRQPEYAAYLLSILAIVLVGLLQVIRKKEKIHWQAVALMGSLLLVSAYSIIRPGTEYQHYLLLLIFPLTLLLPVFRRPQTAPSAAFCLLLMVSSLAVAATAVGMRYPKNNFGAAQHLIQQKPVSKAILTFASPGQPIVIWGWMPKYYVETQCRQGVNDGNTIRCIFGSPNVLHSYRRRLMRDMSRSKPVLFVDVTGPNSMWFNDRKQFGHEVIMPELGAYIRKHYAYVGLVDDTRLYLRKDLVKPGILAAHPAVRWQKSS